MSVSLHRLIRASIGSFLAAFAAPSRNREYPDTFLHSAEVVTYTHKRSKPCCSTKQVFHVHTSLVWGLVDDPSQSLSSSVVTPHTHPFVMDGWLRAYSQSLGHSPLATGFSQSLGPFLLPQAFPQSLESFPACPGLRPFPQFSGPLPLPSFRTTIIDHRYLWALRGPTHYCNLAGCSYGMVHPLICERKLVQLTSPSHTTVVANH
jgi:hypothetical protein